MVTLGTALGVPPSELTTKPFSSPEVVTRGGMPSAYSYSVVDLLHKGNPVDVARFVIVIGYVPQEGFDSIMREGVANAAQKTTSFFTKEYERAAHQCLALRVVTSTRQHSDSNHPSLPYRGRD